MELLDAITFLQANVTILKMTTDGNGQNGVMIDAIQTVCDYAVTSEAKRLLANAIKQANID